MHGYKATLISLLGGTLYFIMQEAMAMITRQRIRKAINVLMMSPLYFRLDLAARQQLIKEFCQIYFVVL